MPRLISPFRQLAPAAGIAWVQPPATNWHRKSPPPRLAPSVTAVLKSPAKTASPSPAVVSVCKSHDHTVRFRAASGPLKAGMRQPNMSIPVGRATWRKLDGTAGCRAGAVIRPGARAINGRHNGSEAKTSDHLYPLDHHHPSKRSQTSSISVPPFTT
jgi:hypothetical protein